jgi:serine/threonine protein kinase
MTAHADRDGARKNAQTIAHFVSDVVDGTEIVVAAGKVSREPDDRMKREIDVLREVKHPNLISMIGYDTGTEPRWYTMPVMRGGSLDGRADFAGMLVEVARGMRQIALALKALHTKAITHRDIKPKNIFLSDAGAWILGDPGIAYRDDDGNETMTRPVSRDWAPTWYSDQLCRSPKADLYMLGKTALSVLVGGDKPLDPTHLTKPKFDLPELYPNANGVRELYDLFRSLVVAEPEALPFTDASDLIPAIDRLLPIIEDRAEWRLQEALRRIKETPLTVFNYANSTQTAVSGPVEGLTLVPIWIPQDCRQLAFWPRGHNSAVCGVNLYRADGKALLAKLDAMPDNVPTGMKVPPEARGGFVRMTITGRSGLLYNLLVLADIDDSAE